MRLMDIIGNPKPSQSIIKLKEDMKMDERCISNNTNYNTGDILKELEHRRDAVITQFNLAETKHVVMCDTINEATSLMGDSIVNGVVDRLSILRDRSHNEFNNATIVYGAEMSMIDYCINVVRNNQSGKPGVAFRRGY